MLEWNDIDFDEKLLFVRNKPEYGYHTKNYEPRSVPINGDCFEALLAQRNMVGGTSENVFPNSFGNPRRNNLYRDLKVCYKRAGITGPMFTLCGTLSVPSWHGVTSLYRRS